MKVTPLFKRWVCFSMPRRRRLKSGLYVGNDSRGSFNRTEEIWIVSKGKECLEDLKMGDHCWVADAFELDICGLDLWECYKDLPEFSKLRAMADAFDGDVVTRMATEDSLLILDNEYLGSADDRGIWLKYDDA